MNVSRLHCPEPTLHTGLLEPWELGAELARRYVLEPLEQRERFMARALACAKHFIRDPRCYLVRSVPGVMAQVMLPADAHVEFRLHVYSADCLETYVHNHSNLFVTYGMYGEYEERIWRIEPEPGSSVYRSRRHKSGHLSAPIEERGSLLRAYKKRYQFPGNLLVVKPEEFHSISPISNSPAPVTLICRSKMHCANGTDVLSSTMEIDAPSAPIHVATSTEIDAVRQRLRDVLNNEG
jgi:hypothetical protein